MLFWVLAAVLTLGACLAVLLPAVSRRAAPAADLEHELEVYGDQLGELERDARRGVISAEDAELARAEIGRRMIKASQAGAGQASTATDFGARMALSAAVLAVPLVSWGVYAYTGSPHLPAQPLQARIDADPASASIEELVGRAEAHLAAAPDDPRGWDVLAPIYLRMGRAADAETAFRNAIRLDGSTAEREAGLGQAIATVAGGLVTDAAQQAFERALALDPSNPQAGYLLGLGFAQEGDDTAALARWRSTLELVDRESPWREGLEERIQEVETRMAGTAPGPTAEDAEAAAALDDDEREAMIETMVASLDARLRAEPDDGEGWLRLVQSYVVLGRDDEAREAVQRGVAALGADSEAGMALSALARQLGLQTTDDTQ
jgi:cytochrome c-type biogenesis protein CcmH